MNDTISGVAGIGALGATGSGATWWLTQINPYLACVSGVLTITFMSWSLVRMWKNK